MYTNISFSRETIILLSQRGENIIRYVDGQLTLYIISWFSKFSRFAAIIYFTVYPPSLPLGRWNIIFGRIWGRNIILLAVIINHYLVCVIDMYKLCPNLNNLLLEQVKTKKILSFKYLQDKKKKTFCIFFRREGVVFWVAFFVAALFASLVVCRPALSLLVLHLKDFILYISRHRDTLFQTEVRH